MSKPNAVFIDTCIFDEQNYNYSSTALSTFVPAVKKLALKLLLPDPTEREIKRHIKDRSKEALDALADARRRAPFLSKWQNFPQDPGVAWEVPRIASLEWEAFMKQFEVVKLGYDELDMRLVMNWYDNIDAPFREKKRKEFPDAFAIALLDAYSRKHNCYIAVVSQDDDMKVACERFPLLVHFGTLPRLTELLLSEDGAGVERLQAAIAAGMDTLEEAVDETLVEVSFYHQEDMFTIRESSYETSHLSVRDVRIVAIGDREATITFEGDFVVKIDATWEEPDEDRYETHVGQIEEDVAVSGTAKVRFDAKLEKLVAAPHVSVDATDIELRRIPDGHWLNYHR